MPKKSPTAIEKKVARRTLSRLTTGVMALPIAKSLVEEQGGVITIESEVGRGSVVRLFLPRAGAI